MPDTELVVRYDGPALEQGRMPVRDLAPALLALSDLFVDAGVILHPEQEAVALEVKATGRGSFDIHLILHAAGGLLLSDPAIALVNLKELVAGAKGLFGLIKRVGDENIVEMEQSPEPGQTRITLSDGTTAEFPTGTMRLYDQVEVRRLARVVVEPLVRDGVEVLEFEVEDTVTVSVEKRDVPAYELTPADVRALGDYEAAMVLTIIAPAFKGDNKWRFAHGDQTIWADIQDRQFLRRVELRKEAFSSGDMLRCLVQVVQTQDEAGTVHLEHHVKRVVEHIQPPAQLGFDNA
jgi:hypothetical protein